MKANSSSRAGRERSAGKGTRHPVFPALVAAGSLLAATAAFSQANVQPGDSASRPNDSAMQASQPAALPGTRATIANVARNPDKYLGKIVTLKGTVGNAVGPNAIRLYTGNNGKGQSILVLDRGGFPSTLGDPQQAAARNEKIQVTGPVRMFHRVDVERELGILLDERIYTIYEGQPAVIVQKLSLLSEPGNTRMGSAEGPMDSTQSGGQGVGMSPQGGTQAGSGPYQAPADSTAPVDSQYQDTSTVR